MTRMTPGLAGPRRDRPGQLAGIGRRRVHLPVGRHDHVTHRRNHARAGRPATAGRALDRVVVVHGEALDPLERPLDGRAMEVQPLRELGERRLGGLAARGRDDPDDLRLPGEPAVRLEDRDRVELAARGAHRPLEVRRLGVEDAVEVAAQRPRHLARLELEERRRRRRCGAGTSRPPRRSSRSRRRGRAGSATTPAARCPRAARRGPAPRPGRPRTRGASARPTG